MADEGRPSRVEVLQWQDLFSAALDLLEEWVRELYTAEVGVRENIQIRLEYLIVALQQVLPFVERLKECWQTKHNSHFSWWCCTLTLRFLLSQVYRLRISPFCRIWKGVPCIFPWVRVGSQSNAIIPWIISWDQALMGDIARQREVVYFASFVSVVEPTPFLWISLRRGYDQPDAWDSLSYANGLWNCGCFPQMSFLRSFSWEVSELRLW